MRKYQNFLKSVYGKDVFNENLDKLSKTEFKDLCENIQNGVPISTPVFDGAKEQDVTKMLDLAKHYQNLVKQHYGMEEQVKNLIDR